MVLTANLFEVSGNSRTARRQRRATHLWECGPRPTLEALLQVESGCSVDVTLEQFGRLAPETYRALGADRFVLNAFEVIPGGRQ
jgi:hypothetical protein